MQPTWAGMPCVLIKLKIEDTYTLGFTTLHLGICPIEMHVQDSVTSTAVLCVLATCSSWVHKLQKLVCRMDREIVVYLSCNSI